MNRVRFALLATFAMGLVATLAFQAPDTIRVRAQAHADPESAELLESATAFASLWLSNERAGAEVFVDVADQTAFANWWMMRRAAMEIGFGRDARGEVTAVEIAECDKGRGSVRIAFRVRGQSQLAFLAWRRVASGWVFDPRSDSGSEPTSNDSQKFGG